jgi:predicted deacylase
MPRVSEVNDPGPDPILKETFARETDTFGFVLNTTRIQAHTPGIMKAAKQLGAAVERSGPLAAAAPRPDLSARGADQRVPVLN